MRLPDPARTRVILLGTAHYGASLPDLPAVANNVRALREVLTDPAGGGLAADRCATAVDVASASEVGRLLRSAAADATDLLLLYYAGHGLVGRRTHDLYLTLRDTDPEDPEFTGLRYQAVREVFLDSPATNRVIILDCCFSGRALEGAMSGAGAGLMGQVDISGTYVLTSAPANSTAQAPVGAEYTAFTGELIRILRTGVPGGPDLLTLGDIYRYVRAALHAHGFAAPQQRSTDVVDRLALVPNRALAPTPPPPPSAPPPSAPRPEPPRTPAGGTPGGPHASSPTSAGEPSRVRGKRDGGLGDLFADLFGKPGDQDTTTTTAQPPPQTGSFDFSNLFKRDGLDVEAVVDLAFVDAIRGGVRELTFAVPHVCERCQGGGIPTEKVERCRICDGTGLMVRTPENVTEPCRICRGTGTSGPVCRQCGGTGRVEHTRTHRVMFPAGIEDRQRIRLRGKGEPGAGGGSPGDAYVLVHVRPDPRFRRDGVNLTAELRVTEAQARTGAEVQAQTLDGPVTLRIPRGTADGQVFRIPGKGVPSPEGPGDLLLRVCFRRR